MDPADALRILEEERERGIRSFQDASTLEELDAAQTSILGRRSRFGEVQKSLGSLPDDERKSLGRAANEVREQLQSALSARREELEEAAGEALLDEDWIDLTLPGRALRAGSLHPFTIIEYEISDIFSRM